MKSKEELVRLAYTLVGAVIGVAAGFGLMTVVLSQLKLTPFLQAVVVIALCGGGLVGGGFVALSIIQKRQRKVRKKYFDEKKKKRRKKGKK
jgi:phosphate/sulfate permease